MSAAVALRGVSPSTVLRTSRADARQRHSGAHAPHSTTPPARSPIVALLVLALSGCVARSAPPAAAPAVAASGEVVVQVRVDYRQRVALPPTAVVRVQLQDIARADAPARLLAEEALTTQGAQVPFAFTLRAPAGAAAPPARLALRARIEVDGQLRFANTAVVPVPVPPPARPIDVVVEPAQ